MKRRLSKQQRVPFWREMIKDYQDGKISFAQMLNEMEDLSIANLRTVSLIENNILTSQE